LIPFCQIYNNFSSIFVPTCKYVHFWSHWLRSIASDKVVITLAIVKIARFLSSCHEATLLKTLQSFSSTWQRYLKTLQSLSYTWQFYLKGFNHFRLRDNSTLKRFNHCCRVNLQKILQFFSETERKQKAPVSGNLNNDWLKVSAVVVH
jgi:hypothetical protein